MLSALSYDSLKTIFVILSESWYCKHLLGFVLRLAVLVLVLNFDV